jgi:hypothetical protein
MSDQQQKYFQFPLFLMRPLLTDPQGTLNRILQYGFFRYAFSLSLYKENIADRVIYSFNTEGVMIRELERLLNSHGFRRDEEYRGFNGKGEFDTEQNDQQSELIKLFSSDPELLRLSAIHANIETAVYNLNSFYQIAFKKSIYDHLAWYQNLNVPDKEPFPQIPLSILAKYIIEQKHDEFDLIQLSAFIAITSILGKGKYKKTNKPFILARMLGYKSPKELPADLPPHYDQYSKRYHFDRLKTFLKLNWNLYFESKGIYGGQYVANAGHISQVDFKVAIKEKQYKTRIDQMKKKEAAAETEAQKRIQHLYK